jgi:hypothetical protein
MVGVAYPVVAFIDVLECVEEVQTVLNTGFFSLPREVTWQTAPAYSMRKERVIREILVELPNGKKVDLLLRTHQGFRCASIQIQM